MVMTRQLQVGDKVKVLAIPQGLDDTAGIGTPEVFQRALGKTFRVAGFGEYGHLELVVSRSDTIWIEPGFVEAVDDGSQTL